MCRIDGNEYPPEMFTETHPTARKEHRCCECGRVIHPGERYERIDGVWDRADGMQTYKTCSHCQMARSWLQAECGGFLFTEVAEDLRDHFYDGGMEDRYWIGRMVIGMRHRWQGKRGLMPVPRES